MRQYLHNQRPRSIRLSHANIELLTTALRQYAKQHPGYAALTRTIIRGLPTRAPYDLTVFAHEWGIVSTALRPEGSSPSRGSEAAKLYALYTKLRRVMVFATVGDEARLRRTAKKLGLKSAHLRDCSDDKM